MDGIDMRDALILSFALAVALLVIASRFPIHEKRTLLVLTFMLTGWFVVMSLIGFMFTYGDPSAVALRIKNESMHTIYVETYKHELTVEPGGEGALPASTGAIGIYVAEKAIKLDYSFGNGERPESVTLVLNDSGIDVIGGE